MTRGDSSVNLLLVSRSKRSSFMYYPGQITATKTAGGGFPQIGGLVQGVPPRKIPFNYRNYSHSSQTFTQSSRWKDLVDFHPTARWSTGALLLETWIRQLGVDGFGSHTGFHCWWSQEKKNGLAELFVARKIHSHSYSALVGWNFLRYFLLKGLWVLGWMSTYVLSTQNGAYQTKRRPISWKATGIFLLTSLSNTDP